MPTARPRFGVRDDRGAPHPHVVHPVAAAVAPLLSHAAPAVPGRRRDFYGKHVNLAARIASEARGGEILVSALLQELAHSGGDIAFGDGREVALKGLSGTQRVFRVEWNG